MKAYETCNKCGASVLASRMADHWIIAQHYSALIPATRAPAVDAPTSRSDTMRAFHNRGNV